MWCGAKTNCRTTAARSANVGGEVESDWSTAIPSTIHAQSAGKLWRGWGILLEVMEQLYFFNLLVLTSAPSGHASDHGSGPRGKLSTRCMSMDLVCAMIVSRADKLRSARSWMTPFDVLTVFLTVKDFIVRSFIFRNGSKKRVDCSTKRDTRKFLHASRPLLCAASSSCSTSGVAWQPEDKLQMLCESGVNGFIQFMDCCRELADIILILLGMSWHCFLMPDSRRLPMPYSSQVATMIGQRCSIMGC